MTYDFKCDTCGEVIEIMCSIRNKPDLVGCKCGGTAKRIYHISAIKYKGSGFYTTDRYDDPNEDPEDLK